MSIMMLIQQWKANTNNDPLIKKIRHLNRINRSMKDICDRSWNGDEEEGDAECDECGVWSGSGHFEWGGERAGGFIYKCEECIEKYNLYKCRECDTWTDKLGKCDCDYDYFDGMYTPGSANFDRLPEPTDRLPKDKLNEYMELMDDHRRRILKESDNEVCNPDEESEEGEEDALLPIFATIFGHESEEEEDEDEFNEVCQECVVKMSEKKLSEEEYDEYPGRDEGYCPDTGNWFCSERCRQSCGWRRRNYQAWKLRSGSKLRGEDDTPS